ncbi:hypothetical protein Tco_0469575 [Tanacetum coccineum]
MTQSQLRIYMSNYLKNQGTWKLSQLKKLKFEEIKEEFDKLVQQIDTFVPINLEATKVKLKRYGDELQTKTSKKQKIDDKDVPVIREKVVEIIRANRADTVTCALEPMINDFTTRGLCLIHLSLKMLFGAYHFNKRWSVGDIMINVKYISKQSTALTKSIADGLMLGRDAKTTRRQRMIWFFQRTSTDHYSREDKAEDMLDTISKPKL